MKRYAAALFAAAVLASVVLSAEEKITVYGLKGPSGVGMVKLFESALTAGGAEISVEALASADLMVARFASGAAKIGILPPNIAAKLASAGRPLAVAAVVGNGMLSFLSADPSVASISDLKGKEVYVAGQGATPDYVFRKILSSNGLDPEKDLSLRYSMAYPEIAQALIAGRIALALLPEPFATMARMGKPALTEPVDVQAEWARSGGSAEYPMTVLVVDTNFAAQRPDALKSILEAYRASVEWTVAHPKEAGVLVEKFDLGLKAQVAAAAIPRSAYVFVPAPEARRDLEALFAVFLSYAPASIGGKLPDPRFYWQP